jgi:hypothetical protein
MATKNSSPEDLCALAVSIIQKHFSAGLTNICDPHFLARRYNEFLHRDDPIYVRLLQGMGDEALSGTVLALRCCLAVIRWLRKPLWLRLRTSG